MIDEIRDQLSQALKQKKAVEVSTLRLLLAEIHNREMEKQAELTEEEIVVVVRKEVKKRREAIVLYRQGNRGDLVEKESQELKILEKYLPQKMSAEELEKIVTETIREIGAMEEKDFGRVMGVVMGKVKGKVEGAKVAEIVRKLIQNQKPNTKN